MSLSYDLVECSIADVRALCVLHHGYGSTSNTATYAFGVVEAGRIVAAYAWQPPPFGAAKSVCPEAPCGVLALSRMVAVPREDRHLNHVSKPLRRQMRQLIDRGRWPVLVTYHDEGQGHTGHVYKCSGWTPTRRRKARVFEDTEGRRRSKYSCGADITKTLQRLPATWLQRWEHWVCGRGVAAHHMAALGWRREPIPGKVWRSGRQAHRIVRRTT